MPNEQVDGLERIRELEKKGKRLLKTIERNRKSAARARAEKKKVNTELKNLKSKHNVFKDMTEDQARSSVEKDLDGVKPSDIFPRDLEREFDKIDQIHGGRPDRDVVDFHDEEEGYFGGREGGVLDLND